MTDMDTGVRFPGDSEEYRRERNRLLEAEAGLRRAIEQVAAQRRALPGAASSPTTTVSSRRLTAARCGSASCSTRQGHARHL